MEKYMINNLEDFAWSLANSIKSMSINDMTEGSFTLKEEIEATVRGCAFCSEIKPKRKKDEHNKNNNEL